MIPIGYYRPSFDRLIAIEQANGKAVKERTDEEKKATNARAVNFQKMTEAEKKRTKAFIRDFERR